MTTIVFDGRYLAADRMVTTPICNHTMERTKDGLCPECNKSIKKLVSSDQKLFLINDGTKFKGEKIIAVTGYNEQRFYLLVKDAIINHLDIEKALKIFTKYYIPNDEKTFSWAYILTNKSIWVLTTDGQVYKTPTPLAGGAGHITTNKALKIKGCTAMDAVMLATLFHSDCCGLGIDYIDTKAKNIKIKSYNNKSFIRKHFPGALTK